MHTFSKLYRSSFVILTTAAACLQCADLKAQVGLGMAPMRVELKGAPGEQRTGTLTLTNESSSSVRARAEILDFMVDETDTVQFERDIPTEQPTSCAKWLKVNPMELELQPRAQQVVRYTIRMPEEVPTGGFHCAIGYTSMGTAEQMTADGIGMRMAVRVVASIYVVVGSPAISGGMKAAKIERIPQTDQPAWRGVVVLENPTSMHYRPTGEVAVLDQSGTMVEKLPFISLPVLPKREQRFVFPLKSDLSKGEYKLRVRVDIGTNEIQEGTVPFVDAPAVVAAELPAQDAK